MKKLRNAALPALAALCAMAISVSCASVGEAASPEDLLRAQANDSWFSIQNFHFLEWFYERDGFLAYGDVDISAGEALWSFTRASRRQGLFYVYAIRNKASGNFLMPDPGSNRVLVTESDNPFRWSWQVGPWGIVLGDARANAFRDPATDNIVCIHMESRNGFAENSMINRTWGTPNWLLHYRGEDRFWAIRSEGSGMYLYQDDDGYLRLGDGAQMDSRFHWIHDSINNILSIRNRRTGHTISVEDIFNAGDHNLDLPVRVIAGMQHWQTNRWIMSSIGAAGDVFTISSGFAAMAGYRLLANPADSTVYLTSAVPAANSATQWRQIALEAGDLEMRIPDYWVRLRNSGLGEYVFELAEGGNAVMAGRPARDDPRSHWLLLEEPQRPGYFRMRNRHSGRDAAAIGSPILMVRTVEPGGAGDNGLWALSFAMGNENLLLRNRADPATLLNVDRAGERGFAEASAQSAAVGHVQWMAVRAPEPGIAAPPAARAPSANRAAMLDYLREVPDVTTLRGADALQRRNERIFTVFAPACGEFPATISIQPGRRAIAGEIFVNGLRHGALPGETAQVSLPLNVGVNSISLRSSNVGRVEALTVSGGAGIARRGATVPFRQYLSQDMRTNALVLGESRVYRQFATEATGRTAIKLIDTGDFAEFTATRDLNAIVIRYSMNDAPEGGGIEATLGLYINGERARDLELSSEFAWMYGAYPWSNVPDDRPKRFFGESHFMLGATLPAGTVIRLQRDAQDTADFYIIDFVDTELVPPPMQRPPNSICITEHGAVAGNGSDTTAALLSAVRASRGRQEVWIPEGVFSFNNWRYIELRQNNLTIRGAGMWHSRLCGPGAGFMINANNVSFYDFALFGREITRDDAMGRTGFENWYRTSRARDWTIQNIWMQHLKVGVWVYRMEGMLVAGTRIRNTTADGINIVGGSDNNIIEQNHIRNTGDDGIAAWSYEFFRRNNTNNRIRFNTVGLPWLASNIAIYGGQDNQVTDNILFDTMVFGGGINISARHSPMPFRGTLLVERNTLLRTGGNEYNHDRNYGAIWFSPLRDMDARFVLRDNDIIDSSYQAVAIVGYYRIGEIIMENNHIDTAGTWAIHISGSTTGRISLRNNTITGDMLGVLRNSAGDRFTVQGYP